MDIIAVTWTWFAIPKKVLLTDVLPSKFTTYKYVNIIEESLHVTTCITKKALVYADWKNKEDQAIFPQFTVKWNFKN